MPDTLTARPKLRHMKLFTVTVHPKNYSVTIPRRLIMALDFDDANRIGKSIGDVVSIVPTKLDDVDDEVYFDRDNLVE